MGVQHPEEGNVAPARTSSGNRRGKRGSAEKGTTDTARGGSGPRRVPPQGRSDPETSADLRRAVVAALEGVLPLKDLPRLLRWVGAVRPEALWKVEELGCRLGDHMAEGGELGAALLQFTEAIALANQKRIASGEPLGPPPIWAFWTLFTRKGQPESLLSLLLREEVGFPSDAEAEMSSGTGGGER